MRYSILFLIINAFLYSCNNDAKISKGVIKNTIEIILNDLPPDKWTRQIVIDLNDNNYYFRLDSKNSDIEIIDVSNISTDEKNDILSILSKRYTSKIEFKDIDDIFNYNIHDRNNILKNDKNVYIYYSGLIKDKKNKSYYIKSFFICGYLCGKNYNFQLKYDNETNRLKIVKISSDIS